MSAARPSRQHTARLLCVLAALVVPAGYAFAQAPSGSAVAAAALASASASSDPQAPSTASADPIAAHDDDADAGPSASGSADAGESVYDSCIEHLPEGATRPKFTERFPIRGLAGHALPLEVIVEHGLGETVLPHGMSVQASGVEADALTKAGFLIPSPDGGAPSKVEPLPQQDKDKQLRPSAKTRVELNVVALPKTAGRHEMRLPPLPIAVARASGEMMTLCTKPHVVIIDDPTASTPDARPKENPPPRPQRETWEAARTATQMLCVALVAGTIGALVYRWWRRRPRPLPPPPPPRPSWELALESLVLLRDGSLLRENKQPEFVDSVSDIIRRYLGDRFGFDGLEATSREVRQKIHAITPPLPVVADIDKLLDESDLIKFARVVPSDEDCEALHALALHIVQRTIPSPTAPVQAPAPLATPAISPAATASEEPAPLAAPALSPAAVAAPEEPAPRAEEAPLEPEPRKPDGDAGEQGGAS